MAIKVAEVGKTVTIGTGYDMSSNTSITVTIIPPSGDNVTVTNARTSITAASYDAGELGTFASNEYVQFSTAATDFLVSGSHTAYVTYDDGTNTFYSDNVTITVEAVGA